MDPRSRLGSKPGLPPQRAPPSASARAKAWFAQSTVARGIKFTLGFATEREVEDLTLVLIESFSLEELTDYVEHRRDLVPLFIEGAGLEYSAAMKIAWVAIRRNWDMIQELLVGWPEDPLSGPSGLIIRMRHRDPRKAAVLDTPEGRRWWDASCYNLLQLLRYIGRIEGPAFEPPPNMPPELRHPALLPGARH